MQSASNPILTIIAVIAVLVFLGVLFLINLLYHNNRRRQLEREKNSLKESFEKEILISKLEIREQTFNSISQELHDNVGQTLTLAKLQLKILDQNTNTNAVQLQELKSSISKAMNDVRDIANNLSSDRIRQFNLEENIRDHLDRLTKVAPVNFNLKIESQEREIDNNSKIFIFRMFQEAIQNIIKHANASHVNVEINYREGFEICIVDNGIGFDIESQLKRSNGLGLQNLQMRAKLAGGQAVCTSSPGNGTSIKIFIPYA